MNQRNFVICDSEIPYVNHLMEMIAKKKEIAFQVRACTSLEHLMSLQREQNIDLLLITEEYPYEERNQVQAQKVFVLTREKQARIEAQETPVYKYQSVDGILSEILQACLDHQEESLFPVIGKNNRQLIGIYAPVHRSGKTTFALALGKELAKKSSVLYLNLEAYASGGVQFPEETKRDLGDLLYFARQESGNFGLRVSTVVSQMEELDYVPPMKMCDDLKSVTAEEWQFLLGQILDKSIYEIVILDLGECVQGIFPILELCQKIYMPVLEDAVSLAKLKRYEQNLQLLGLDQLGERTKQFVLPPQTNGFVKQLLEEEAQKL